MSQSSATDESTALKAAVRFTRRGWRVLPIPHRSKNPGRPRWQDLRLTEEELPALFNGKPQNIGVLLGEPSGWLIDIDLDHPRAVALADDYLPATPLVFGRASKPRSHRFYHVTKPLVTKKFRSKSAGMIVEVRSTGCQTVVPPSTHESGEAIVWDDEDAEPATIEAADLLASAEQLAAAVRAELEERSSKCKKQRLVVPNRPTCVEPVGAAERSQLCLAAMRRLTLVDNSDGSLRLYSVACRAVEFDLDDQNAVATIRQYARQHPFPREWTDQQVLQRVRDAEKRCRRGAALAREADEDGCVVLGTYNPPTGKLVLSLDRTLPTAEAYVREFCSHPDGRTLQYYLGLLWRWDGSRYVEVEEAAVKKQLQVWLHDAERYSIGRGGEPQLLPFPSNPRTVSAALETIKSHVHLPSTVTSPVWLSRSPADPPPQELLPCLSTVLHLPTNERIPTTPRLFTTNALRFDYEPQAPEPKQWLHFLDELFGADVQSRELLQEWFGYCLTADTSQQKMMLIVGPRRSGKGTIGRVLQELVGADNVCSPTTGSLAENFGLQPLLGKTLAMVSDARFRGESIPTIVERLLLISGEDSVTIARKYMTSVTVKLPTRLMFLSNELPELAEASGALAGRFVILRLINSFYGREDRQLTGKLLCELPGILNWSIAGWRRLNQRGHFVMPERSKEMASVLEDLGSPVGAFVRDECLVGSGMRVNVVDLNAAWTRWCERTGAEGGGTVQTFGKNLLAAVPGVRRRRGTNQVRFYEGIGLRRTGDGAC